MLFFENVTEYASRILCCRFAFSLIWFGFLLDLNSAFSMTDEIRHECYAPGYVETSASGSTDTDAQSGICDPSSNSEPVCCAYLHFITIVEGMNPFFLSRLG